MLTARSITLHLSVKEAVSSAMTSFSNVLTAYSKSGLTPLLFLLI